MSAVLLSALSANVIFVGPSTATDNALVICDITEPWEYGPGSANGMVYKRDLASNDWIRWKNTLSGTIDVRICEKCSKNAKSPPASVCIVGVVGVVVCVTGGLAVTDCDRMSRRD